MDNGGSVRGWDGEEVAYSETSLTVNGNFGPHKKWNAIHYGPFGFFNWTSELFFNREVGEKVVTEKKKKDYLIY